MLGADDSGSECTEALSLGLCNESDDEFSEPEAHASEQSPDRSAAGQSSAAAETEEGDCTRCKDDHSFVPHDDGCKRVGVYRRYVVCPRCRHVACTRSAFRHHLGRCMAKKKHLTSLQRRNRYNPLAMMQHSEQPIELHRCGHCHKFSQVDTKILALHELYCRDSDENEPPPPLPARSVFYADGKKFALPLATSCEVVAIFKRHTALRVHTRLGFLWPLAEAVVTCAEPQVVRTGVVAEKPESPVKTPQKPSRKRKVKSVVTVPVAAPTAGEHDVVSPLVLKRHRTCADPEKRRYRDTRFTVTKKRQRTPSPRAPPALEQPQPPKVETTRVYTSPRKPFAFGEGPMAIVTPTQRSDPENPLPTPPCSSYTRQWHRDVTQADQLPAAASTLSIADIPPPPPPPRPTATVSKPPQLQPPPPPPPPPAPVASPPPVVKLPNEVRRHLAAKERLKIELPGNRWCDAYGRPTSPRMEAKRAMPKPTPSMTGHLISPTRYTGHPEVAVEGHLPSGWGRIILPSGIAYPAYKATPGDPEPVPKEAMQMSYYVAFFLTTLVGGERPPAGTLHFDVDLRNHSSVQYQAAGISTRITTATSGGQGS